MKKFNILFAIASLLIFAQGAWAQTQIEGLTYNDDGKFYEIPNASALNMLATYVNAGNSCEGLTFKVTDNITFAQGTEFTPIGTGDDFEGTPFAGTFDGQDKTISGIQYEDSEGASIGLFGHISSALIQNVKLEDCTFTGNFCVGAIAGLNSGYDDKEGKQGIYNCTVGSGVTVTAETVEEFAGAFAGGIIGDCNNTTISGCVSAAKVNGVEFVGGIAGRLLSSKNGIDSEAQERGVIEECYFTGKINGDDKKIDALGARGPLEGYEYDPDTEPDAGYTNGLVKLTLFADDSEQTIKNSTRLNNYNGQTANVTMSGLKLANDKWSTICLPFEMSGFNGTPFAGADVKVFKAAEYKGNTLTATFEDASKIDVGIPYIVKGAAVDSPEFEGVKVGIEASAATFDHATFIGTFNPVTFNENDRTILYLGDDNKLYFPKEAMTINPFHAYFKLQNGIKACSSNGNVNGDEDVTVADITSLVNIVKNPASQPEKAVVADVNDDNDVTVDDVAALANIILGKDIEGAMRAIKTDDAIGISYGFGGSSEKPARARKM